METFKISKDVEVICESKKTRNGFKHVATLRRNGHYSDEVKCCYLNRTWERYTYESVLKKLAENTTQLSDKEKKKFQKIIKGDEGVDRDMGPLRTVGMIAALGDIFSNTKKESNDWKARMLKAGLGNSGLSMPEDWDTLSEEEKEKRLNGAMGVLRK